jgi:hypothetical protein
MKTRHDLVVKELVLLPAFIFDTAILHELSSVIVIVARIQSKVGIRKLI